MRDALLALRFDSWVLPALVAWPVIGAAITVGFGRGEAGGGHEPTRWPSARGLTTAVLFGEAALALGLWILIDPAVSGWQAVVDLPWIRRWGARFAVGVDGISLVLVTTVGLLMPLAVLASPPDVEPRARRHYALLLTVTAGIIGVVVAIDLLLFYLCWQIVIVPSYFLARVGRNRRRGPAVRGYLALTGSTSLLLLVAVVVLWVAGGSRTSNVDGLLAASRGALSAAGQIYLFAAFSLAFAAKSACFPLHVWMPGTLEVVPAAAAVALGIDVGMYGLVRFAIPLFPAAATHPLVRLSLVAASVVGVVYAGLLARQQRGLKRAVAYAAVAHVALVTLGLATLTARSLQGALLLVLTHALTFGALSLLAHAFPAQVPNANGRDDGGRPATGRLSAAALALFGASAIGLPGTSGFVGARLVLADAYRVYPAAAIIVTCALAAAAVHLFRLLRRAALAPTDQPGFTRVGVLDGPRGVALGLIATALVWIGVVPGPVLRRVAGPTQRVVEQVTRGAATPPLIPGAPEGR